MDVRIVFRGLKQALAGALVVFLLAGCAASRPPAGTAAARLAAAEAFIDAFYSFDASRLRTALSSAAESLPAIGFYQGWAEGGNYEILQRTPCRPAGADEVQCSITVKDDLIPALGLGIHVTDTFHITFEGERIVRVRTSSDDPPLFEEALQWVRAAKPEVLAGPCRGFFDGGPTPGDCVRAVVQGFAEFRAHRARR